MKVIIKNARLSFPALFSPDSVGDGEPKYGCKLILPPKSPSVKLLDAAILQVANDKWEKKGAGILKQLNAKDKVCLKKEPYAKKDGTVYDGFAGMYFINASNEARPTVQDRNKSPLVAADGKPYGGCYVNAVLDVWAQDNNFGQRVNATLLAVQFVKDGDHFAGGAAFSDDDFDDLGMDEEDEEIADDSDADDLA